MNQPYLFKNITKDQTFCQGIPSRSFGYPPVSTQCPQEGADTSPKESSPWDGNEAFFYSELCRIRQNQNHESTLVNRLISHRKGKTDKEFIDYDNPRTSTVVALAIYPETVKILRDKHTHGTPPPHAHGQRGEIQTFTPSSRRRLKHVASNSSEPLISQFCLTYHNLLDKGPIVKRKLDVFLKCMRRKYPTFKYLWILEFQTRGFPHFHLYYNLHHNTPGLRQFMAKTWNRVSGEKGNKFHYDFHNHPNNNIAWDMGSAQYLTKYLDKTAQKSIPPDYGWSGRFWGCSRGLVKPPMMVSEEFKDLVYSFINQTTGEVITQDVMIVMTRQIGKLHERRLRKFGRKSRARKTPTDYTISCASKAFWQLWEYYYNSSLEEVPF